MTLIRRAAPVTALALVLSLAAAPVVVQAQQASPLGIPIVGTVTNTAGTAVGTFAGTFNLQRFVNVNGQVAAVGRLTGVITQGTTTTSLITAVTLPITVTQASCSILHLDLGPLNLNLLGLRINLSRIVLDITAEPGPGNLLGNLLCAIAGLLDNPNGLVGLLNNLLRALSSL